MAERLNQYSIFQYGGLNVSDQADQLTSRSHQGTENGFVQQFPQESPDLCNIDFDKQGIRKRKGSAENDDITGVLVSGEILIRGIEWQNPATGAVIEVVVGKKSIYTNQSGSWAQINNSASSAYTHADQTVTKVGFAMADGHLFIGLDGSNKIQVYRSGADLDAELDNGNTYEDAYGAGTHTITGTWTNGCFLIASLHNRLIFSDGNTHFEYTPMAHTTSSGIWDLGGSTAGFYNAQGRITALTSFSPHYANYMDEVLYIGTVDGIEMVTGFQTADRLVRLEGSKAPMNHQAFCKSKNWIVYLTEDKNIYGINGSRVIDLGRRLKRPDLSGPLDGLSYADSSTNAFAFYNPRTQQAMIHFTTGTSRVNDRAVVIDFKLGEPSLDETQDGFERRVRLLLWDIASPDDNDWFVSLYETQTAPLGLTSAGKTYTINSGNNDLDTLAIESYWKSPIFTAGAEMISKQWQSMHLRGEATGNYNVDVDVFLNRGDSSSKTWEYSQGGDFSFYGTDTYGSGQYFDSQTAKGNKDVDLYAETIQWQLANNTASQTYKVSTQNLRYLIGAEER